MDAATLGEVMTTIRLLLVDGHGVLRAGLRMLLNSQPDMEVVGAAATAGDALRLVSQTRPDVAVLEVALPDCNGIRIIKLLRAQCPRVKVLLLTAQEGTADVRAALAAGAAGYVPKREPEGELLAAIRAVHAGRTFVHPSLTGRPAGKVTDHCLAPNCIHPQCVGRPLTQREREVLILLGQGHTNKEVAARLLRSVKTVETHRTRIARKLGLRTRSDLVRYALETGLLN